jgi:trehalose utilization protein
MKIALPLSFLGICFLLTSCKFQYVQDREFIGRWELKGRPLLKGLRIKIMKENEEMIGTITQLPENESIASYMKIGEVWLKGFERTSNYSFLVRETRPASELFSLYGQTSTHTYKAEFMDDQRFGISDESGNPQKSDVYYERVIE